jgi:superkiller protein 3
MLLPLKGKSAQTVEGPISVFEEMRVPLQKNLLVILIGMVLLIFGDHICFGGPEDAAKTHFDVGQKLKDQGILKNMDKALLEQSAEELKKAIGLNPQQAEYHCELGWVFFFLKDFETAKKHKKRAIALDPENMDYVSALGNSFREAKNLDEAAACYQKVVEKRPASSQAAWDLASVYIQKNDGDFSKEIEKCLCIISSSKRQHFSQYLIFGRYYYDKRQYEKAVPILQKIIDLKCPPRMINEVLEMLEESYKQLNVSVETWKFAEMIEEKNRRKDPQYEEQLLIKQTETEPENAAHFYTLGKFYEKEGKFGKAIAPLEMALKMNYPEDHLYYLLGRVHEKCGNREKSLHYFRTSHEKRPNNQDTLVNICIFLQRKKAYDEAILFGEKLLKLNPNHQSNSRRLGALYLRKGRFSDSEELLKVAIQTDPENPRIRISMGLALAMQDKAEEAQKQSDFLKQHDRMNWMVFERIMKELKGKTGAKKEEVFKLLVDKYVE